MEQFNTRKINQLNKRIASKMKEIRGSFAKMKKDVDDLNKKLYSKDETTQYFKDITEWRLAERLATDLTSRLQEKQQTLNRIVLKDKTQAKYIKEAMPGHMQSDDAAGKLQNLFEEFERDQQSGNDRGEGNRGSYPIHRDNGTTNGYNDYRTGNDRGSYRLQLRSCICAYTERKTFLSKGRKEEPASAVQWQFIVLVCSVSQCSFRYYDFNETEG